MVSHVATNFFCGLFGRTRITGGVGIKTSGSPRGTEAVVTLLEYSSV